jgi:predicted MPP superfamily phosphohydrolase
MLSRRQFLGVGGAVLATAAGVPLYAWQVEPHWVEIVRRPMPLEHLPPALDGRTLLQISDMHVGPSVSSAYLIDALERARVLAPDFVVFTGDFVTYRRSAEFDELARVLRHMPNGRLATVAALGNHDYGRRWRQVDVADRVTRIATDAGLRVLRNEVAMFGGLQIAGLADVWSPEFGMYGEITPAPPMVPNGARSPEDGPPVEREARAAVQAIEPRQPTVILSHNPDVQDLPIWDGVRGWVLAGHTHGGQVKPPFLPPPVLPVKNKRYTSGEFSVGPGRTLYINRGLGYLVQVRFNVRPELTLFTLQRAATTPS